MDTRKLYEKNYKKLLLIPVLLLVLSITILAVKYASTGDIINKDVSLKGGVSATLELPEIEKSDMESYLSKRFTDYNVRELTDFSTRQKIGLIIDVADTDESQLTEYLSQNYEITSGENYSVTGTGSTFGQSFYKDLVIALLFAFLFMAISVSITFRTFIPSVAVISAALIDILATVAITSLIGMKLSPAGIITFLLVIGYSIDTDIVLTTRMIKERRGDLYQRISSAMKTGLTMTGTTIVALIVAFMASASPALKQMFLILLIALVIDIISTYAGNASMLVWYCKKKGIQ
ncbi:MAG: hypothetical protein KKG60_00150 [Nanoarchaeota archaeon]|nr:hypothetical protein [Nanoarchaeota archaeon]